MEVSIRRYTLRSKLPLKLSHLTTHAFVTICKYITTDHRDSNPDPLAVQSVASFGSVKNFHFSLSSRPAVEPTQPLIRWVPVGSFHGSKAARA
jgi:hypothetical protein